MKKVVVVVVLTVNLNILFSNLLKKILLEHNSTLFCKVKEENYAFDKIIVRVLQLQINCFAFSFSQYSLILSCHTANFQIL